MQQKGKNQQIYRSNAANMLKYICEKCREYAENMKKCAKKISKNNMKKAKKICIKNNQKYTEMQYLGISKKYNIQKYLEI